MEKIISTSTPMATTNGRRTFRKAKKFSDGSSSPRRKSLQLLQPVAGDQSQLVGSDGIIRLTNQTNKTPKRKLGSDGKSQPRKVFRPDVGKNFTIFEDASKSSSSMEKPSAEQETVNMMTSAEPTPKYWEELAEERRVALEETLKENEQLYTENCELKEKNEKLQVMADQAEYLADVVETLMGRLDSSCLDADSKHDVGSNDVSGDDDSDNEEGSDGSDHEGNDDHEHLKDDEEDDEVFDHDVDSVVDAREVEGSDSEEKEDEV